MVRGWAALVIVLAGCGQAAGTGDPVRLRVGHHALAPITCVDVRTRTRDLLAFTFRDGREYLTVEALRSSGAWHVYASGPSTPTSLRADIRPGAPGHGFLRARLIDWPSAGETAEASGAWSCPLVDGLRRTVSN